MGGLTRRPAGRRRARDGRGHRDRREPRHAADEARAAGLGARRDRPDDRHPHRAGRARLARVAEADRRPDRAGARQLLGRGLQPPAADRPDRRGRSTRRRASALGVVAAADRLRVAARATAAASPQALRRGRRDSLPRDSTASIRTRCSASSIRGPASSFDQDKFDRDLRRLYGSGDFEHVDYQIIEEAGKQVVSISAIEKSSGPDRYSSLRSRVAVGLQGRQLLQSRCELPAHLENALGAEWRTDVRWGRSAS